MAARAAALLLACLPAMAPAADAPLRVVASFSILGDIVRQVGGPDVTVDTLVGPDGDAHTYEPTPSDTRKLGAAQVLVVNGLQFEAWLPRLLKAADYAGRTVVASEGVAPRRLAGDGEHGHEAAQRGSGHAHEEHDHDEHDHDGHDHDGHDHDGHDHDDHAGAHHHHHGEFDPHAWQSLKNGAVYARNIAEALAQADPARAAAYRERGRAYAQRLEQLDAQVRATFDAIPAGRRTVVTSHDAFGYFGDAYGVRFIPVAGMSTQAEPSASELGVLIKQVREAHVPAVFVETVQSPRLVETVARETGARVGGTLYSDALAQPGTPAGTYIGMFEWNVRQLADAMRP
ncbi:metal ABC transporter substrate-binding protein [Bordetella sp. 2513F-2]